ncbi:uncharacterized protein [Nicotiana sylvestris]|uniref:uncharacterized protein n=1 Tax=Nicotiana sylvestris TaxID=4096 RepID=UPI00388C5D3B
MEDLDNVRKENPTERVEATNGHSTQVPKENVSQLEQKLLKFQEELDQVRNLASLSFSLSTPDIPFPNTQNPTPPQNISKKQNHPAPHTIPQKTQCNTCHTPNNTPLLIPELQNSTNDHFQAHHNTPIYVDTMPHSTQDISNTPESDEKDLHIRNLDNELMKLTSRIQGVEGTKGIEGLNYADLCIQPNVEFPKGYKPPMFEMFDGISDPRVYFRTYYDKLVGVGKDERIRMKLFMRSLKGDALSWYISQDPKKWLSWIGMASDFMDKFRFNTENVPDVFYIQNLKKKPTKTFREYATHWRVKIVALIPVAMSTMTPFHTKAIPWDYKAEARRKGKVTFEETIAAQGMTRTGRVYTPKHLVDSSKQSSNWPPIIETRLKRSLEKDIGQRILSHRPDEQNTGANLHSCFATKF